MPAPRDPVPAADDPVDDPGSRRASGRSALLGSLVGLAALVATAALVALLLPLLIGGNGHGPAGQPPRLGDGTHVASYGFDLDPLLVDRTLIAASGMPRDGLVVVNDPEIVSASSIDHMSRGQRGKLLVPSDRVVGIVAGDQVRAYPLRFLRWHEVVNDTIAGIPIVVTYSPLCDSVMVARRAVGDQVLRFGLSGLLLSSNLLLYDLPGGQPSNDPVQAMQGSQAPDRPGQEPVVRRPSLWSQLQARAIAGPAAALGLSLEILPSAVTTWELWQELHPGTGVMAPVPGHARRYRRDPYSSYLSSDILRFPVRPLPGPEAGRQADPTAPPLALKDRVLVVDAGSDRLVVALPELVRSNGTPRGVAERRLGTRLIRIRFTADPPTMMLEPLPCLTPGPLPSGPTDQPAAQAPRQAADHQPPATRFACWFAWYALQDQLPAS